MVPRFPNIQSSKKQIVIHEFDWYGTFPVDFGEYCHIEKDLLSREASADRLLPTNRTPILATDSWPDKQLRTRFENTTVRDVKSYMDIIYDLM